MKTWAEFAEAFTIFAKYEGNGVQAEHDEIFAGPNPELVTAEDMKRLEKLGWSPHWTFGSFHKYI